VSLALAMPGSPMREPILAQMSAIDAALAARTDGSSWSTCVAAASPRMTEIGSTGTCSRIQATRRDRSPAARLPRHHERRRPRAAM